MHLHIATQTCLGNFVQDEMVPWKFRQKSWKTIKFHIEILEDIEIIFLILHIIK